MTMIRVQAVTKAYNGQCVHSICVDCTNESFFVHVLTSTQRISVSDCCF